MPPKSKTYQRTWCQSLLRKDARSAFLESYCQKETHADAHCSVFLHRSLCVSCARCGVWAAVFARVPPTFVHGLDATAVKEQVQRTCATSIRQTHIQCLLETTQSAEIQHLPIQPQQASNEPRSLSERHPKQKFQRLTGQGRSITETSLPPSLAIHRRHLDHLGVKLDR